MRFFLKKNPNYKKMCVKIENTGKKIKFNTSGMKKNES